MYAIWLSRPTHGCLHVEGVCRAVRPANAGRPQRHLKMRRGRVLAVGIVVELVAMLERVAGRGRPVGARVHHVMVVVVVVCMFWRLDT